MWRGGTMAVQELGRGRARSRGRNNRERVPCPSRSSFWIYTLLLLACQLMLLASAQDPASPLDPQEDADSNKAEPQGDVNGDVAAELEAFGLFWLPFDTNNNGTIQEKMLNSTLLVCNLATVPSHNANQGSSPSHTNLSSSQFPNSTRGGVSNTSEAAPSISKWNYTFDITETSQNNPAGSKDIKNETKYAWWNCSQDFSSVPTNISTFTTTQLSEQSEKSDFAKPIEAESTRSTSLVSSGDVIVTSTSVALEPSSASVSSTTSTPAPSITSLYSDALNVSSSVLSMSMSSARSASSDLTLSSDTYLETSAPMVANGYLTSYYPPLPPADSSLTLPLASSMIVASAATSSDDIVYSALSSEMHDALQSIMDASATLRDEFSSHDFSSELVTSVTVKTLFPTVTPLSTDLEPSSNRYDEEVSSVLQTSTSYQLFPTTTPSFPFEESASSSGTGYETPALSTILYTSQFVSTDPVTSSVTVSSRDVSPSKTQEKMTSTKESEEAMQGDQGAVESSSSRDQETVSKETKSLFTSTKIFEESTLLNSIEISPSIGWTSSSHPVLVTSSLTDSDLVSDTEYQTYSLVQSVTTEAMIPYSSIKPSTYNPKGDSSSIRPSIPPGDQTINTTPVLDSLSMATKTVQSTTVSNLPATSESVEDSDEAFVLSASSALFSSLEWPSDRVVLPSSIDTVFTSSSPPSLPHTLSPTSLSFHDLSTSMDSVYSTSSVHAAWGNSEEALPTQPSEVARDPSSQVKTSSTLTIQTSSSSIVPLDSAGLSSSVLPTRIETTSHELLPSTTTLPPTPKPSVFSESAFPIKSSSIIPSESLSSEIRVSTTDAVPETSSSATNVISQTLIAITPTPTLSIVTNTASVQVVTNLTTLSTTTLDTTTTEHGDGQSLPDKSISSTSLATTSTGVQNQETTASTTTTSPTTSATTSITSPTTKAMTTSDNQLTSIASADNKSTTAVIQEPSTTSVVEGSSSTTTSTTSADEKVLVTTTDVTSAGTTSSGTTVVVSRSSPRPIPMVTEPPLNTTELLMEYWVKTVIEERSKVDVTNISYISNMELKLSSIYDEGFNRLVLNNRRRRATKMGDTNLQMVNVTRDTGNNKHVTMVYFMERYGNLTPALQAVAAMETFNVQEITLRLGVIVITKAEVYAPPVVEPPHDPKLWLIAAVIGGIVGFILLVWCILFIYCKCTQPAKQRQRTPRTPRSTRISMTGDYDTNSYRNKMPKIQGFDIARTEVGLENEIQRDMKRKPPEPYRKRPDGSTELEGMYSPGETPPPKQPGDFTNTPPSSKVRESGEGEEVTPVASLNMNKSRSQIPIDASLRRSLPPRPDSMETLHPPKKKSSSRRKRGESEESESEDDLSEDRKPLQSADWQEKEKKKAKKKSNRARQEEKPRSKSKKKHRKSDDVEEGVVASEAGVYENIAKMSKNDPTRPEKLRSTQHAIKLPPLITQPLVGEPLTKSLREETELQESLQQKADIERWRNKQRQRERTKGSKSSRTHPEGDARDTRHAYKRAQREIAAILGDPEAARQMPVFQKKKRKKKRRPAADEQSDTDPGTREIRKLITPVTAQYSSTEGPLDKQRSPEEPEQSCSVQSSDDDDSSYLDDDQVSNEPSLEEARQRMHELVDNAFALISPRYRKHNRIAPSSSSSFLLPPRGPAPLPAHGKASARARRRVLPSHIQDPKLSNQGQAARNTEEDAEPRHTPLYITPVSRRISQNGEVLWSPYSATDQVSQMSSDQQLLLGVISSNPGVHNPSTSSHPSKKPTRSVAAYQYTNEAYINDSDGAHDLSLGDLDPDRSGSQGLNDLDPITIGSHSLANTSLSRTNTTNSSGADSGAVIRTPRELRDALQHDGYTSLYMDSSLLNPKATRSHSPPERDTSIDDASDRKSDFVSKENQENSKHLTGGVAKVLPLGSQAGSLVESGESLSHSKGPLDMLSEQTSVQLPASDISMNAQRDRSKRQTEIRLKNLDPKIPTLCESGEMDEIDIIHRAKRKQDSSVHSAHWNRSLRAELERLANHSSADTTITTAMV